MSCCCEVCLSFSLSSARFPLKSYKLSRPLLPRLPANVSLLIAAHHASASSRARCLLYEFVGRQRNVLLVLENIWKLFPPLHRASEMFSHQHCSSNGANKKKPGRQWNWDVAFGAGWECLPRKKRWDDGTGMHTCLSSSSDNTPRDTILSSNRGVDPLRTRWRRLEDSCLRQSSSRQSINQRRLKALARRGEKVFFSFQGAEKRLRNVVQLLFHEIGEFFPGAELVSSSLRGKALGDWKLPDGTSVCSDRLD